MLELRSLKEVTARCEDCGRVDVFTLPAEHLTRLKAKVRAKGWVISKSGSQCWCPDCGPFRRYPGRSKDGKRHQVQERLTLPPLTGLGECAWCGDMGGPWTFVKEVGGAWLCENCAAKVEAPKDKVRVYDLKPDKEDIEGGHFLYECRSCQFCDLSTNRCILSNTACYGEGGVELNEGCTDYMLADFSDGEGVE